MSHKIPLTGRHCWKVFLSFYFQISNHSVTLTSAEVVIFRRILNLFFKVRVNNSLFFHFNIIETCSLKRLSRPISKLNLQHFIFVIICYKCKHKKLGIIFGFMSGYTSVRDQISTKPLWRNLSRTNSIISQYTSK